MLWCSCLPLFIGLGVAGGWATAQAQTSVPTNAASTRDTVTPDISTYVTLGVGGFIPLQESYRLNYSTSTAGIPLEIAGGLMFPVSNTILTPLTVRYIVRKANFVDGMGIATLSIEPGVRFYLEKQRDKDFRTFAGVSGLLAEANAEGSIEATQDGSGAQPLSAQHRYLDMGLGFDLGFSYPVSPSSALDAVVHAGVYFSDPSSHGGIGNIGGISLSLFYRFGF